MGQEKEDSLMTRRGENIRKRKDGRWEGRYPKGKRNGKPLMGSVFSKTYQETKNKLIAAKAAVANASSNNINNNKSVLFLNVAETWLTSVKSTLKESTISRYRTILDKHLYPQFGNQFVNKINRSDVSEFITMLLSAKCDGGKELSPKSVSGILSVMKNVMNYAQLVQGISVIDFSKIGVKLQQKKIRIFSNSERKKLNVYLLNEITFTKLGVLLCLYTGLRVGEVCALKWSDISFLDHRIRIERTMQRIQIPDENGHRTQVIITSPKSDSSVRDIPIPDDIYYILEKMKVSEDCYILTGKKTKYIEPRTFENRFSKIIKECGISNASPHTCRHTFATCCVELGFDIKTLSEILGHANVSVTMNRYVHPSMELKKAHMNKLSGLLGVKISRK